MTSEIAMSKTHKTTNVSQRISTGIQILAQDIQYNC